MGVVRVIEKLVAVLWTAALAAGLVAEPTNHAYPANWSKIFQVYGQSRTWRVTSLFSPADFSRSGAPLDLGFEFSTGNLTYTGPPTSLRWYRMEIMLPQELSIRVRPGPPGTPSACAVDTRGNTPWKGATILPGAQFNHGICDVYPWRRSSTELASEVTRGLYVVSWEDDTGVHAEVLPLSLTSKIGKNQ